MGRKFPLSIFFRFFAIPEEIVLTFLQELFMNLKIVGML